MISRLTEVAPSSHCVIFADTVTSFLKQAINKIKCTVVFILSSSHNDSDEASYKASFHSRPLHDALAGMKTSPGTTTMS